MKRERGIDLGTFEDEEEGDIDGESDVELDGNDQLDLDLDSDLLSDTQDRASSEGKFQWFPTLPEQVLSFRILIQTFQN